MKIPRDLKIGDVVVCSDKRRCAAIDATDGHGAYFSDGLLRCNDGLGEASPYCRCFRPDGRAFNDSTVHAIRVERIASAKKREKPTRAGKKLPGRGGGGRGRNTITPRGYHENIRQGIS